MSDKETEQKFSRIARGHGATCASETGCPWDKEQTHLSLKPCLLEETYELARRLGRRRCEKAQRGAGRCLLQVIFHAQIAAEESRFTIEDVIAQLTEKLIRRHPYVFAGEPLPEDTASVLKQRMQIKASEKKAGEVEIGARQRAESDAGIGARAMHLATSRPSGF